MHPTFEESIHALAKQPKKKLENKHEKLIEEIKRKREYRKPAPSIEHRKNILDSQNRINYILEYDRLNGMMKSGNIGLQQSQKLNNRKQELKQLVHLSVGGKLNSKQRQKQSALSLPHEIYNK